MLLIIISASGTYLASHDQSVKVGVMLPLSGDLDLGFAQTLDWACETINSSGEIGGKRVELVYYDTNVIAASDATKDILSHDNIHALGTTPYQGNIIFPSCKMSQLK